MLSLSAVCSRLRQHHQPEVLGQQRGDHLEDAPAAQRPLRRLQQRAQTHQARRSPVHVEQPHGEGGAGAGAEAGAGAGAGGRAGGWRWFRT